MDIYVAVMTALIRFLLGCAIRGGDSPRLALLSIICWPQSKVFAVLKIVASTAMIQPRHIVQ